MRILRDQHTVAALLQRLEVHTRRILANSPRGISVEDRDNLPIVYVDAAALASPDTSDCAICLEPFELGMWAIRLPACRHLYCKPCAMQWLKKNCTCPRCRAEVCDLPVPEYDGTCCGFAQLAKQECKVPQDAGHIVLPSCAHLFHRKCIEEYVSRQPDFTPGRLHSLLCPMCQTPSEVPLPELAPSKCGLPKTPGTLSTIPSITRPKATACRASSFTASRHREAHQRRGSAPPPPLPSPMLTGNQPRTRTRLVVNERDGPTAWRQGLPTALRR